VIGSYARVAAALGSELSIAVMTRPTLEELGEVFDESPRLNVLTPQGQSGTLFKDDDTMLFE
jgi:hypothetical protein